MNTLEHLAWLGLRQSESARACRACGHAIRLDDRFGLSEGVCDGCRTHGRSRRPDGVLERLRRGRLAA